MRRATSLYLTVLFCFLPSGAEPQATYVSPSDVAPHYSDNDMYSRVAPANRRCSVCMGVSHQLRTSFERRENERMIEGGSFGVLGEIDMIEALDEACSFESMDEYGFIKPPPGDQAFLNGPGLNWFV